MSKHIQVAVRIRPSKKETNDVSNIKIKEIENDMTSLTITEKESSHSFDFDFVFPQSTTQQEIHERIGTEYVDHLIQGFNTTIFAYGQTGSGKTYTMYGKEEEMWGGKETSSGLVPRITSALFERIALSSSSSSSSSSSTKTTPSTSAEEIYYTIKCTFVEVYNNTIRDLLSGKRDGNAALNVRETPLKGVWIDGVKEIFVASVKEIADIIRLGFRRRAVKATKMNDYSSRYQLIKLFNAGTAWTRLREKEKELREREECLGKEKNDLKLERERQEQTQRRIQERENELKQMQIQQSSDSNLSRIFFPVVGDEVVKEKAEKHTVVSQNINSSDLMMASFEKLWEKANQDADLAMLSDASSFSTSSTQRPQSALVRVCFALFSFPRLLQKNNKHTHTHTQAKRLSAALRLKRVELQDNLKKLIHKTTPEEENSQKSSSPIIRGKIVRVAGSRKIFIKESSSSASLSSTL